MNDLNLLWATPVLRSQTESHALAEKLEKLILNCELEEFRNKKSLQRNHNSLFESEFDFLSWKDDAAQEFKSLILSSLGGLIKVANQLTDEELNALKIQNHCWFHITRSGGYFQPHNHPNASWSAIYCVSPGDETANVAESSGCVFFEDPRLAGTYLDAANNNMRRDMSFNSIRLRLKTAELLIFPSYLIHFVEPYIGDKPRITIAANFWFHR